MIGMAKSNNLCGVGVAYDARIGGEILITLLSRNLLVAYSDNFAVHSSSFNIQSPHELVTHGLKKLAK